MTVVKTPVHNEQLYQGSDDSERSLYSVFGNEIRIWGVKLVRLLPQENFSFKLEGEHGAEQPVHELAYQDKEVATCNIWNTLFCVDWTNLPVKGDSQQTNEDSLAYLSFHSLWLSFDENERSSPKQSQLSSKSCRRTRGSLDI